MHNFKSLYDDKTNIENKEYWNSYLFINKAFANKVIEVKNIFASQHPKMIWVHDIHLLMVPIYVKKTFPEANIGFYLHTPFPSSDIFRMFQFRFDILQSLLQCDLIGFHLFEYARNFFKSCHRLMGLDYEFSRGGYLGVNFHGKNVMLRVSHIGIDESFVEELVRSKTFKKLVSAMQTQLSQLIPPGEQKPIIISSIDSFHPIRGLLNKLLTYYEFLKQFPAY